MEAASTQPNKCCCRKPQAATADYAGPCQPVSDPAVWSLPWVVGRIPTPVGDVPIVSTTLTWRDRLGAWKVRWAIGRMSFRVPPGLYAVGSPDENSPILATANYKLSFDQLRSQLAGRNAWVLVLDTKGVNVWCAAAKGTFSTDELVRRTQATGLAKIVSHDVLIAPQLGAVGVSAGEARTRSGFRVLFGPVRATDVPQFLDDGFKSPSMHLVRFALKDRVTLVPVELVQWARKASVASAALAILASFGREGCSWEGFVSSGLPSGLLMLFAVLSAVLFGATLLPWLPGRAFSCKGAWLGACIAVAFVAAVAWGSVGRFTPLEIAGWCIAFPVIASYVLMDFTGVTPYTSVSGVRWEVRRALPLQIAGIAVAAILWLLGRFVA